jgi:hypothetical protein
VWWYSRALKRDFNLSGLERPHLASAFPGVTRDGRVIFGATWFVKNEPSADCGSFARPSGACVKQTGYIVLDPYQQPEVKAASGRACITREQVRSQQAAFARFHNLPN